MVKLHRNFKKMYAKLPLKKQHAFSVRFLFFVNDHFDSALHNHPLKREWKGCRSIQIDGDIRAIYTTTKHDVVFLAIGTHSSLYK